MRKAQQIANERAVKQSQAASQKLVNTLLNSTTSHSKTPVFGGTGGTAFAILRTKKHKDFGSLARCLAHQFREQDTPNADPGKSSQNARSGAAGSAADVARNIMATTAPLAKRKDAVRAVELLLTASPEWFARNGGTGSSQTLYAEAKAFLRETFGAQNVVTFGIHRDEKTPHVYAVVTPIFEGKLQAKKWLGGRDAMRKLQDDWHAKMALHGCARGMRGSKATHVAVGTYYAAVNGSKTAREMVGREWSKRAVQAQTVVAAAEAAKQSIKHAAQDQLLALATMPSTPPPGIAGNPAKSPNSGPAGGVAKPPAP